MLKEFMSIDKNGDGMLTKEELIIAYNNLYNDSFKSTEIVN